MPTRETRTFGFGAWSVTGTVIEALRASDSRVVSLEAKIFTAQ